MIFDRAKNDSVNYSHAVFCSEVFYVTVRLNETAGFQFVLVTLKSSKANRLTKSEYFSLKTFQILRPTHIR